MTKILVLLMTSALLCSCTRLPFPKEHNTRPDAGIPAYFYTPVSRAELAQEITSPFDGLVVEPGGELEAWDTDVVDEAALQEAPAENVVDEGLPAPQTRTWRRSREHPGTHQTTDRPPLMFDGDPPHDEGLC